MLITIGAFDGFHRGHAGLLRLCRQYSDDWGVVTFQPHPGEFMGRLHPLFTLKERELVRKVLGIPKMFVLRFDDSLMRLSTADFWHLLRERLDVDGVVIGSDFRFGYGREGSAQSLRDMATADGLKRVIIAPLIDKAEYSSTVIRRHIMAGNADMAGKLLGYPYFVISRVIHGEGRGRTMNFPTANLDISGRVIPAWGVYSSAVLVNGSWHCGALSIGNNPTFTPGQSASAEVHVPGFDGDIYGHEVIMLMLGRVRNIRKFPGAQALSLQIASDTQTCRDIYREVMCRDYVRSFTEKTRAICEQESFSPQIINLT